MSCTFWTGHTLHTHKPVGRRRDEGPREQAGGEPKRGASGVPFDTQHPHASRMREVGVEDSYEARELAQRGR